MIECYIVHISKGRIRIKIPSAKGNEEFFNFLLEKFKQYEMEIKIKVNVTTGSLVIEHDKTTEEILSFIKSFSIFEIKKSSDLKPRDKIIGSIKKNFDSLDGLIRKVTSEALDLNSAVLLFLITSAIYQIARGNLVSIPWYTALFYLNALISKK